MKKQNLDEVIPFRLPKRQKAALLRIARKSGRAASVLLRELVEQRIALEAQSTAKEGAAANVDDDGDASTNAAGDAGGETARALGAAA